MEGVPGFHTEFADKFEAMEEKARQIKPSLTLHKSFSNRHLRHSSALAVAYCLLVGWKGGGSAMETPMSVTCRKTHARPEFASVTLLYADLHRRLLGCFRSFSGIEGDRKDAPSSTRGGVCDDIWCLGSGDVSTWWGRRVVDCWGR